MDATPSEIAITQATHRVVAPGLALWPPEPISSEFIKSLAGDQHGPPHQHRQQFPDGRVGSHSALATVEQGATLLRAAINAVSHDYEALLKTHPMA
jgi:creatinine amidohydrolase